MRIDYVILYYIPFIITSANKIYKIYNYSCSIDSRCVEINLLQIHDYETRSDYGYYIDYPADNEHFKYKNIIMNVTELIVPANLQVNNYIYNFYDCYNHIQYSKHEYYHNRNYQQVNIVHYKISLETIQNLKTIANYEPIL